MIRKRNFKGKGVWDVLEVVKKSRCWKDVGCFVVRFGRGVELVFRVLGREEMGLRRVCS